LLHSTAQLEAAFAALSHAAAATHAAATLTHATALAHAGAATHATAALTHATALAHAAATHASTALTHAAAATAAHAAAALAHATPAATSLLCAGVCGRVGSWAGRSALLAHRSQTRSQVGLKITAAACSRERRGGAGAIRRAGIRIRGTAPVCLCFTHD
jgi:hypothetical protein